MPVFALADCNNFYVSCERAFNPKLNNQPVIVFSNNDGCTVARSNEYQDKALEITPIEDVWGIGRRYATYFTIRGIKTALDFKYANIDWIKKKMGINGVRMQKELCGESCYTLDDNPLKQKSISSSRSFKQPVTDLEPLFEAVSTYIAKAAEKLRKQGSYTETITVYVTF